MTVAKGGTRRMRPWGSLLVALCLGPGCAGAGPGAGATVPLDLVDVTDYEARLSIEPDRATAIGWVRIRLTAASGVEIVPLTARVSVDEVRLDGGLIHPRIARDTIFVPLVGGRGGHHVLEIRYVAAAARGLRINASAAYTIFDTPSWMPVHWSIRDRATLSLSLELPAGWTNHAVGEPRDGGWRLDEAMPPYLFGFAAGPLTEIRLDGDRGLRVLASDSVAAAMPALMRDVLRMIDFLEDLAGTRFPLDAYTQVFMPDASAQELATFTILPERYADALGRDSTEDHLLIHELAHQWWGNRITAADWSHFWLHEGVASFIVALWKEERWGSHAYAREIELARARVERARANGRGRALVDPSIDSAESAGGPIPYSMGLLALHMLRREIGDESFRAGLRSFTARGRTRPVTTSDLRVAMEAAAGRSLQAFFENWVFDPAPDLAAVVSE